MFKSSRQDRKFLFSVVFLSVFIVTFTHTATTIFMHEDRVSFEDTVSFIIIRGGVVIYNHTTKNFITNIGLDYCKQQLGGTPTTDSAHYISLSASTQAPLQSWTILPDEMVTGGLERAAGVYASLGNGQWKIEKVFTATAPVTGIQISGLHWALSGDSNLFAVTTMPAAALQTNDQLVIQWTVTIARAT
jgi:hypothetical protein